MRSATTKAVTTSAKELGIALRSGAKIVVLEVDRESGDPAEDVDSYPGGHIPGAHHVSFERDLVGPRTATSGNSPLPDPSVLQERLWAWGVDDDSTVVVHTRRNPAVAARAWWLLRWAGVEDVRYLDGGLAAWLETGGALDAHVPPPARGKAVVRPGALPVLTAEDAGRLAAAGHLVDARAAEAYRGDPDTAGTGHIPGAHSVPGAANFAGDELLDAGALRALYTPHLDGREVGAYCGSGVSATTTVLALASLGVEAALYPGSWSAWTSDPTRPTTLGDRPGADPAPAG
ncbi:sulfurtransferase [Streptomyces sp. NPDC056749]|uniref:sulfurtransferase n=1 Tax=Streptomyces sp. NPDC056749 TaxID=3345936 RepID=UPI0036975628